MNEVFGNNVLMEVYSTTVGDYVPFICCKDLSITFTPELINITTVSSGKSNEYKARRYDYELSLNGISSILGRGRTVFTMAAPADLLATHLIRLTFEDATGNVAVFGCRAPLKSLNITGNQDAFSDFSYNFQGSGVYTLVQSTVIPVQLSAPVVTATAVSNSQINLSWINVHGNSGYRVYRNGINHFPSAGLAITLPAGVTTFSDTGLSGTSTFYYWVVAIGDVINYLDSLPGAANATTFAGSMTLGTPSVSGVAINKTEVQLVIASAVTSATQYQKQIATDAGFANIIGNVLDNNLTSNFSGVAITPGTLFYLRAKALASGYTDSAWGTATVTSLSYNQIFTFNGGISQTGGGVTGTAGVTNTHLKFEFDSIASPIGLSNRMMIRVGGFDTLLIDYPSDYENKNFYFVDNVGVPHIGTFTNATVNF